MATGTQARALGLDFGTTNSVAAIADGAESRLVEFAGAHATGAVFRSALCFWEDDGQDDPHDDRGHLPQ